MRNVALCAASAAVLLLGVYLFIQVHASPARADAPSHHTADVSPPTETPTPPPVIDTPPDVTRGAAGQRTAAIVIKRPVTPRAPEDPALPAAPPEDPPPGTTHVVLKPNPKLDSVMSEASKAYDKGDLDEARDIAKKVLDEAPGNIRMLRIMVSAACLDNDQVSANKYYAMLPKGDQAQMRTRCDRYGMTFPDSAAPTP